MSRFGLWAAAVLPSITLVTSAQGSDDCAARYKNYLEKFTPDVQRKMSGEQLAALNRRAQRIYDACEEVALGELGLDVYPNQIEVITAEQMLDAYSSVGMPLYYKHWSFGKHFAFQEASYRKGLMGLAYEIVINSSPCISYLMEENTATMQTLVTAHAAFGHNHFFKNNYLFKQWTDADGILDYLEFAKKYVTHCEHRHGTRCGRTAPSRKPMRGCRPPG